MTDGIFDAAFAPFYDRTSAHMFEPGVLGPTVDFLRSHAGGGRALEFASGTGRVALPLHRAGTEVAGIEMSHAMIEQMLAKAGGEDIAVTIGDMTSTRVAGEFTLVYLVYNTIGNLLTQDEQVACFVNAAAHLSSGGCFVVENAIPQLRRLPVGARHVVFDVSDGHIGVDEFDTVHQQLVSHHVYTDAEGRAIEHRTPHRYTWPAELDLMARIAGMTLRDRWGWWDRRPFTDDSESHISVWVKD